MFRNQVIPPEKTNWLKVKLCADAEAPASPLLRMRQKVWRELLNAPLLAHLCPRLLIRAEG
jgi:hypothetical protein